MLEEQEEQEYVRTVRASNSTTYARLEDLSQIEWSRSTTPLGPTCSPSGTRDATTMPSPIAQASIDIHAPISLVYDILLHLAAYPDWNPFIVKVTNITPSPSLHPITTNTKFTLHCKFSDGTTSTSRERVTEVTPPDVDVDVGAGGVRKALLAYRFTGALAAVGVVKCTRFQWLEQQGEVTSYRTEEAFKGVGAAFVPVAQVQEGFERMADALKARAESM